MITFRLDSDKEILPAGKEKEKARREKIPVHVYGSSRAASVKIAASIAALIRDRAAQDKHCVLGLPTGSTPVEVYDELVRLHNDEGLSFRNVITFSVDEYYPMNPGKLQSYVRFMREHLLDQLDILKENMHIPDGTLPLEKIPEFCRDYEKEIEKAGGIDIQLLGIGRTGHIGFNEPGSGRNSVTRLITLDHVTIADAASDFFGEDYVPRKAITMGVGTLLSARQVILLAWGEGKAKIIKDTVEGPVSENVPASFLQQHPNALIVLDEAAAAELTRFKTPWLTGTCHWDDAMIRKAVIWLCQETGKPILKLTNRDYNEHHMGDLVARGRGAYDINIRVFNQIQHAVSGWPGGKPGADDSNRPERAEPYPKRVIVFSPHPDDDVISMGGTLTRLVDQGHDVHVAYQTSGNIAVFDDDVIRFAGFVTDFSGDFFPDAEYPKEFYGKVLDFFASKKPGQVDIPEIQKVKTLIRKVEAKAACRFMGIPDDHIHFLEMPFYETGRVKKNPLGEEDLSIIRRLLEQVQPHQIFAAGDLSDPHGTHRVCLDAVMQVIDRIKKEPWMKHCYVWFYRGAWQEWNISDAEMLVPLSPDEVIRKRKAIFKHQSQKDKALFPGTDEREFWQRAEDRNHQTAVLLDKLGLAEYQAVEAFVKYKPE
ncbi:MAG: glucosamine-6-phosphate deaminase [Chlorobi bacterium]|nr:glucosamine-6-phosphate deaminase [Chlorobiota bacterium]